MIMREDRNELRAKRVVEESYKERCWRGIIVSECGSGMLV
jgi:hypothetical protein